MASPDNGLIFWGVRGGALGGGPLKIFKILDPKDILEMRKATSCLYSIVCEDEVYTL